MKAQRLTTASHTQSAWWATLFRAISFMAILCLQGCEEEFGVASAREMGQEKCAISSIEGEGQNCETSTCPEGLECFEKDKDGWAACLPPGVCTPGMTYRCDPPQFRSPWSCESHQAGYAHRRRSAFTGGGRPRPVDTHGQLRVHHGKIVDKNYHPVQLKGMSLFWSNWGPEYWNRDVVKTLAEDWHASVVRCPMAVDPKDWNGKKAGNGYVDDKEKHKQLVATVVNAAIEFGIYVIIDWHEHHAEWYEKESKEFFEDMAREFGSFPNVIFETYNEPVDTEWWQIKNYHENVIPVIRKHSPDNLILLGTPTYSQEVDVAAKNPVEGNNLAYVLHFYAGSHKDDLRERALIAMDDHGQALFVSEWGMMNAAGQGKLDYKETEKWLTFMNERSISWANWAINDAAHKHHRTQELPYTYEALVHGTTSHPIDSTDWGDNQLTDSGKYVKSCLTGEWV